MKKDFGSEVAEHVPAVWRFALSMSGRPDVADDLAQSTCLRALEKEHQFQEGSSLVAWLMTICRSIWLNELRSHAVRKTGALDGAVADTLVDSASSAEMNIFTSEVFIRIRQLPEAQRAAVQLVYVEQFTYAEASKILEVPIGTIMSRLHTARRALADLNDDTTEVSEKKT